MRYMSIFFAVIVFAAGCLLQSPVFAADEGTSAFGNQMEDQLQKTVHYYDSESMTIKDYITVKGHVVKVIKADDPDTEANEETIEEYDSNLAIAYVEYQQVRDSLFYFTKTELLFYDIDKDEFLTSGNVLTNKEIKVFFDKYVMEMGKHMNRSSEILIIVLLALAFLIPFLIMLVKSGPRTLQNRLQGVHQHTDSKTKHT
ncbi:hypothetical protein CVD28_22715 [Bacillus sp. M6-12]|uniref:hypothetical protein n=1 Tax=Bacillus sp. M6-12 TaxID=2054166 RepID=UPI000C784985|nr:hypothetical protein [Bacillus sp. M6-12]PLS15436.1 hypothetical protein CVD28_22715 [Bacillus sp. M6-12]